MSLPADKSRERQIVTHTARRKTMYLLCYDIREPKRLKRIQRHVSLVGVG